MRILLVAFCSFAAVASAIAQEQTTRSAAADNGVSGQDSVSRILSPSFSPWKGVVGDGFRRNIFETDASLGAGFGMKVLESSQAHDLALARVNFGWIFTDVVADQHWYRGNWELLAEVFAGAQYRPDIDYVVGIGPALRYNFATGSRWVPFIDGSTGVSATSIRAGDLSTTFEFNLQAGVGTHYFFRENLAATLQYRFLHLSNANLKTPNRGVNDSVIYIGLSWFY